MMGLLDSVLGGMAGGARNGLGGGAGKAALVGLVLQLLMQRSQGGSAQGPTGSAGASGGLGGMLGGLGGALGGLGGLGGLIARFQQGGLGDIVGSWVGTGQNLPVSPDQVNHALGPDLVSQIARQLGLSHEEAAGQLAEVLPEAVDHLTPGGELPAGDARPADAAPAGGLDDISAILGRFAGR